MIHLSLPIALVAVLFGAGLYGVIARRNAVLVLIGIELMLAAAGLLFVTAGTTLHDPMRGGQALTIFLITIAAAEISIALAVVLAVFRARDDIDVTRPGEDDPVPREVHTSVLGDSDTTRSGPSGSVDASERSDEPDERAS